VRLATWNVNSITARLPRLLDWLETCRPDVACLQETKVAADDMPVDELRGLGYEVAAHGMGRWNGVAVVSRVGLEDVRTGLDDEPGVSGPGGPGHRRCLRRNPGAQRVRAERADAVGSPLHVQTGPARRPPLDLQAELTQPQPM
jgi:exonuclease III